ncbi:tRNA:m(4)X modification enzyme TRM13 homolog [Galendromus occidentalis]|uniref:tRNA:m(4)X modification enzyme TRM13 n=1 Tax=Galendromus occidentalis TaxID=34638 RepID=A0AAJ7SCZ8_9ACAR|nr:tRNA:m(4)X modification enzyme TRM13 homolog [Galendromus occidentalis]
MSELDTSTGESSKRAVREEFGDPCSKKQREFKLNDQSTGKIANPDYRQCQYLVVRKNRRCRQRANKDCDYCGEHLLLSNQKDGNHGRIPCPLDPSHSCYAHLLEAHLKKCNARKKPMPDYYVEGINGADSEASTERISVHTVGDEELLSFIERIDGVYRAHVSKPVEYDGCHELILEELEKFKDCAMVNKHLNQQGALLKIMEEKGLLEANQMFVEFGAGRGQLATWVMRSLGDDGVDRSAFVLVDRGSQRYKADNRFVDKWGASIHRIRADIRHLCLERLDPFKKHEGRVVGFCKHLCGVAIDLALRCITGSIGENRLPQALSPCIPGIVMAVCCHHRCEWRWYSGKEWLESLGLTERDFQLMVSIAGWATCGSGCGLNRVPAFGGDDHNYLYYYQQFILETA